MRQAEQMERRYSQLAKSNAKITRVLAGSRMKRLLPLCLEVNEFEAQLSFELTEESEIRVTGEISGSLSLACLRCDESVNSLVSAPVDVIVFESEEEVEKWIAGGKSIVEIDVVVSGPVLEVLDLVEDQLILHLPRVICSHCKSDNGKNYVYSAGPESEKTHPFSKLSEWDSQ